MQDAPTVVSPNKKYSVRVEAAYFEMSISWTSLDGWELRLTHHAPTDNGEELAVFIRKDPVLSHILEMTWSRRVSKVIIAYLGGEHAVDVGGAYAQVMRKLLELTLRVEAAEADTIKEEAYVRYGVDRRASPATE